MCPFGHMLLPFTHVQSALQNFATHCLLLSNQPLKEMILFLFTWKIWDVPESGNTPNMLSGQTLWLLSSGCVCAVAPNMFLEHKCMNAIVSSFVPNAMTFIYFKCPNIFSATVREHELKLDDSCLCATFYAWQCHKTSLWVTILRIFLTRHLLVLFRRTRQCKTRTHGRASTRRVNIRTTPQWMY